MERKMTELTITDDSNSRRAALPTASTMAVDDTLDRIADHRRGCGFIAEICSRMGRLEGEIPEDRRKSWMIYDRGTDVGKNDDMRWLVVQAEYWAMTDHVDEIAWSFIDRPPTTVAGIIALLRYATEHEEKGWEWPNRRHAFEHGVWTGYTEEDWKVSLLPAICRCRRPQHTHTEGSLI
jgi:hypothetical protein